MIDGEVGFSAIRRGDYQEALNIFRRALEKKREARFFQGLGIASDRLGDHDTARWALNKALELNPDDREIPGYLAALEKKEKQTAPRRQKSSFRVSGDYIEINDGKWQKLFIKGINLGLGLPGYFPGELPVKKGTYLKWFAMIAELGVNAVRIYAVHPPPFYEALYEFNQSGKRLFLFQGIWAELPPDNDFYGERYLAEVKESARNAVDVIFGNASLPERPGHAHGAFDHDVSPYTIALIFGREWESCAVKGFNELRGRKAGGYRGEFLSIHEGTPFEVWTAEVCDFLQSYEYRRYEVSHPLSVTNWPTLDPLLHPSESNHEEELLLQGIRTRKGLCNENEDMEFLDVAKIKSMKGGGVFATYHVYPYYPDFMNNDYPEAENPYRAYLQALKDHHRGRPVLIAEFGVPSSRENTHWQREGLHHGGHNEARQGRINGLLLKAIREAGMAGGVLFSWFDEWFKRNWLFLPYEIPPERNPFWFNLQDAEQNYGLLAAYPGYPGKRVNLSGKREDWTDARTLYEKGADSMAFRFDDGFDDARTLRRLLAQHDEGFLYLLVETAGKIDFAAANYMIGLDTFNPEWGEFLFPFDVKLFSPFGMKFLIHLAGREKSRVLVCRSYDKYTNFERGDIRPAPSDQGEWIIMLNRTNYRRINKDGRRFYPSRVSSMSGLRFGSLDRGHPDYDSLADFFFDGNRIELRIPWGLINVTDPSSRMVLWRDREGETRKTEGIRIVAVSYKPRRGGMLAEGTGRKDNVTDSLPGRLTPEEVATYSWEEWNVPVYHTYQKESYHIYKEVLSGIPEKI